MFCYNWFITYAQIKYELQPSDFLHWIKASIGPIMQKEKKNM